NSANTKNPFSATRSSATRARPRSPSMGSPGAACGEPHTLSEGTPQAPLREIHRTCVTASRPTATFPRQGRQAGRQAGGPATRTAGLAPQLGRDVRMHGRTYGLLGVLGLLW